METCTNSTKLLLNSINSKEELQDTIGMQNVTSSVSSDFWNLDLTDARMTLLIGIVVITTIVKCYCIELFPKRLLVAGHRLRIFLEDAGMVLFCVCALLALGAPYGVFLIWRLMVHTYLKIRYGDLGELMEPLDVIGTLDTSKSRNIIKALQVLEGTCDLESLRSSCIRTVGKRDARGKLVYPKFYQQLDETCGFFCWKPANMDIAHHVRLAHGLDINSASQSESRILGLISEISNGEFEPGRPSWEMLVVPEFNYDHEVGASPKFGIIIRIHHSIGDGYSLLKLILKDMAGQPNIRAIPMNNLPTRPLWYGILAFLYLTFKSPRVLVQQMKVKDTNPLHTDQTVITGQKSLVWSQPIKLEFLKEIKTKMNIGMSTFLLSALAGALRKYMLQEYNEVPDQVSTILPMPAPNHPNDKMTNKFSIVLFPLNCQSDDPIATTKQIECAAKEMASAPNALANLFLMKLGGVLPVAVMRFFLTNSQATLIVSNLPGPIQDISIWGNKLLDTMFWLPSVGNSGVSVSFLSYANNLRIGLTTDSGVIPDGKVGTERLLQAIIDGIVQMAQTANANLPTDSIFRHTSPTSPPLSASIHDTHTLLSHRCSLTDNSNSSEQSELESEDDAEVKQGFGTFYLHGDHSSEEDLESSVYAHTNNMSLEKLMSLQRQHTSFVQKVPGKLMENSSFVRSRSSNKLLSQNELLFNY